MNEREITALVNSTVKECREFFIKQGWATSSWNAKTKLSFSSARARSWGGMRRGQPFISLALRHFLNTTDATFREYQSFQHDPQIGTVAGNTAKAIKALVIHEMSHAIQYSGTNEMAASVGASAFDSRGHGLLWKGLYRTTRNALLNGIETVIVPQDEIVLSNAPIKLGAPRQNTMKRADALAWIREAKARGQSNRTIINTLVMVHRFKKTTATTYTYSV